MAGSNKTHWFRTTLCVLVACGILGTILSAVLFIRNPGRTSVSANIQFSFDGAADGIAPNGYGFDISAVSSDEVLNEAISAAGMADKYTADQLRQNIQATGVYPENIVQKMMSYESILDFNANRTLTISEYYPTQYRVELYNDFDKGISAANLRNLLTSVMEIYRVYFVRVYSAGAPVVEISYNLEDYDYPQRLTILSRLMEQAEGYALAMYEKEPTLMKNGQGFNDIAVRLNNLIETDIAKLNASITINALTKNTARLMTQYQYEIRNLNNQLARKKEQLTRLDDLIASYDKNEIIYLSTTDSLTKIDGNSSKTYDALVADRKGVADEITAINTQIATYQLMLSDLTRTQNNPAQTAETVAEETKSAGAKDDETAEGETAEVLSMTQEEIEALAKAAEEAAARQTVALEKSLDDLLAKREAIMQDFVELIQLYNDRQINDLTVTVSAVTYYAPKILSGSFIVRTLKVAGPICAVGFMVCLVLLIISRTKEQKKAA